MSFTDSTQHLEIRISPSKFLPIYFYSYLIVSHV